ncbi:MAG: type II toxin-antitoxin system death-on-curing family toxin [Planctomycetota bacterium]|nr:MAG: type II toxin-antitoxin system death-on-curing family toxin [Planctomycetota bacterium]
MNWLSLPELLAIHADVIDATGGVHGVVNAPALESALARPFTTYDEQPLYPSFVDKLAAMIHSIIAFHPFVDGNKRTALVAAEVLLRFDNQRISPGAEVEEFFWSIARGERNPKQIATWLAAHVERLPGQPGGANP